MSAPIDNAETIRLATLVGTFNQAANVTIGNDPQAVAQLRAAMTPERVAQLQRAVVGIMVAAQQMMLTGETEDAQADIAAQSIRVVDLALSFAFEAGLEDKFRAIFPAEAKTPDNAAKLQQLGAPHIARLCA